MTFASKLAGLLVLCFLIASCGAVRKAQQMLSTQAAPREVQKAPVEELKAAPAVADANKQAGVEQLELPKFERAAPPKPLPPPTPLDTKKLVHVDEPININIESMPLSELIVHALGGILKVNLFIDEQVKNMKDPITIRTGEALPPYRAMELILGVLESKNLYFEARADTLFVYRTRPGVPRPAEIRVGQDVPDSPADILQVVVLKYARPVELEPILREVYKTGVAIRIHPRENALILSGQASSIKAMMELVQIFDVPYVQGKNAFVLKLQYWQPEEFAKQLTQVLEGVGFTIARSSRDPGILLIPIKFLNSLLVIAPDDASAKFVLDWRSRLDTAESAGTEEKAFTYVPEYARATDIVDSIKKVYGIWSPPAQLPGQAPTRSPGQTVTQPGGQAQYLPPAPGQPQVGAAALQSPSPGASSGLKIAADERRNVVLLVTAPSSYRSILTLLKELDAPVKQVLIEATVAELTLKDDLSLGFEYFLKTKIQGGSFDLTTIPRALNLAGSALNVSFIAAGERFAAFMNLLQAENKVNILSRPRLMVLDNQEATIQVGTDVPIITQNLTGQPVGNDQTILQSIQYRNTGVLLTIKPTINAKGLVTLDISQEVSEVGAAGAGGSPTILTRKIRTTVVAGNDQTVVLGGLMSENNSATRNKVPWFGDLPVLGYLFKSESSSKIKTELIVFISPRILDNVDDASRATEELKQELRWLK